MVTGVDQEETWDNLGVFWRSFPLDIFLQFFSNQVDRVFWYFYIFQHLLLIRFFSHLLWFWGQPGCEAECFGDKLCLQMFAAVFRLFLYFFVFGGIYCDWKKCHWCFNGDHWTGAESTVTHAREEPAGWGEEMQWFMIFYDCLGCLSYISLVFYRVAMFFPGFGAFWVIFRPSGFWGSCYGERFLGILCLSWFTWSLMFL